MVDEKTRLIRARSHATFRRQGLRSKKKKLKETWRRPRGLQSKQRKQIRAKGRHPRSGFGGPAKVRGFHPSGYQETMVFNLADMEGVNPETHAIRIAAAVGNRKRMAIQEKALEYGIKVLNARDFTDPEAETTEEVTDNE